VPLSTSFVLTWLGSPLQGFLPYEVFEEIAANYGDEMARLVVSFDNLFITGQQAQGFKARTRPLRDPVQLLVGHTIVTCPATNRWGLVNFPSYASILLCCNVKPHSCGTA
jgi:hypothetical protein